MRSSRWRRRGNMAADGSSPHRGRPSQPCYHFVLVTAAVSGDGVQCRDCARRIIVVALRENPAAQHVAGRWAELVRSKGICGQLVLGGGVVDALHADWRRASGGEQEPGDAAQSERNVSRRRALHIFRKVRQALVGRWHHPGAAGTLAQTGDTPMATSIVRPCPGLFRASTEAGKTPAGSPWIEGSPPGLGSTDRCRRGPGAATTTG